jgi:hypothetical protein
VRNEDGTPAVNVSVLYESIPDTRARGTSVQITLETRGGEEVSEHGEAQPPLPDAVRTPWVDSATVGEDGAFEFANLPPGLGRLFVVAAGDPRGPALVVEEAVLPGGQPYDLVVPARSACFELRPALPEPWRDAAVEVRAIHESTGRGASFSAVGDRLRSPRLAPGWYRIEIGAGPLGWHDLGRRWLGDGETADLGEFAPPAPGSVRLVLPAAPVEETRALELAFYARRADLDLCGRPKSLDRDARPCLPAGEYWAFWTAADGVQRHRAIRVEAGARVELDLR